MVSAKRLFIEMNLVGFILVAVSLFVDLVEMLIHNYIIGKESQPIFGRPYIMSMIRGIYITGALTHLLLEISDVNRNYAKNYK